MTPEVALEVCGLSKRYKKSPALANDAIDLAVERGTVFGLLGPNGAGKTTLVRQVTGELTPTSGSIRLLGVDVVRDPLRAKALMGVVPQEALPFPYLRPREHLALFGKLHGLNGHDARRRADQLMTALGLEGHERLVAMHLSGGLKRKLLVGIALMARPPVLVLDEPTTGLDPHSRREVWSLLQSQKEAGTTVLITTHYMDEAEALCDTVAVIGAGKILARGAIEELRGICRNRYKAVFSNGNGRETIYGMTQQEVFAQIEKLGVQEYSFMRTSLEDLYLELTGRPLEEAELA